MCFWIRKISYFLSDYKMCFFFLTQSYLADLVPSVFGSLNENGYFYDPVERGKVQKNLFTSYVIFICLWLLR